jgi:hypothetical protein
MYMYIFDTGIGRRLALYTVEGVHVDKGVLEAVIDNLRIRAPPRCTDETTNLDFTWPVSASVTATRLLVPVSH